MTPATAPAPWGTLGAWPVGGGSSAPVLAPRPGQRWASLFSDEDFRSGGGRGAVAPEATGRWTIPGQCTLLLASEALPP